MNAPDFTFSRGIGRVAWSDPPVEFIFDLLRLERRTGDLTAEVTVMNRANGHSGLVHRARANLGSTRSCAEYTGQLARTLRGIDWPGLMQVARWKTIEAFRAGPPPFLLKDAVEPAATGWALKPLLIAADPVIWHGDGGALKSYGGLSCAVSLQSGIALAEGLEPARTFRVAYLDFEWNPWPHHRRLRALCGPGELPDILYVPCQTSGPLTHQVERLQRIFERHAIEYAIVDSVGLACDGPPEEAQSAIAFFQALARLEVGSLLIAHTNRDGDTTKPFGSAFWHNSARATWYVRRLASAGSAVDVALYNRKANDGERLEQPIGLRFIFTGGTTNISKITVDTAAPEPSGQVALKDRMMVTLRAGAMTYVELAEQLDAPVASLRQVVKRWEGRIFTKLTKTPDGIHRIGLASSKEPT